MNLHAIHQTNRPAHHDVVTVAFFDKAGKRLGVDTLEQGDDEVMSQLGTKITCLLDNERDVDAVLTGVSGSRKLRSVLARLESKQQALVFGHALPMPVVIQTREYGSAESYRELGFKEAAELKAQMERDVEDLFGPSED